MFRTIADFESSWQNNTEATLKLFKVLTDASLKQSVADGHRDLARIAWHIVATLPEMSSHTGLKVEGPSEKDPIPENAQAFYDAYEKAAKSLLEQIKSNWNDESLLQEDNMYGMNWMRGLTLKILIDHEIHHRGQMTVLMRQAGIKIPGVFGPSKEEWAEHKMDEPLL
jgi:uncharacterized damage-inducible protein DinB